MSSSVNLLLVLLASTGLSKAQTPQPASTVYVTPVPSPTPPTCPRSNGTVYNAPSGSEYIIECDIDHFGGDMGNTRVTSLEECILDCDAEPSCVDVSLSGVACYLKSTLGPPLAQKGVFGARRVLPATSTASSTVSATPTPLSCPSANGVNYTANTYARFEIGCDYETAGGDMGMAYVWNLEECVQKCDDTEGCVAASLSGSACYLKSSLGALSYTSGISYARLTVPHPECPSPSNTTYTATNGKEFAIECNVDHPGGDIDSAVLTCPDGTGNCWFGECIERCASNPDCVDISLSGAGCYLKGAPLRPASTARGIFGARWIDAPVSTPSPSPSPSPVPDAISPVDVGNFEYLACYNDSVGHRALQGEFLYGTEDDPMTAEICAEFCDDSQYFGLEYGQECYCADRLTNNPLQTPDACDMPCSGNTTQLCGGSNALSLYRALNFNATRPTVNETSTTTPTPTSSPTASSSSPSFILTVVPIPATGSAFPTSTGTPLNSTNSTTGWSWASNSSTPFRFTRRHHRPAPVRLNPLAYNP